MDLYLLRHAKSSWDDPALADHDRPLAPRGRRAAKAIAGYLREEGITPEFVLCSSSVRTRETLAGITDGFDKEREVWVETERDIYGATAEALLARMRDVPAGFGSVMVIGHQPAIQKLALELVSTGEEATRLSGKFPTAALATFTVPGAWSELVPGCAQLTGYVKPRDLY